MKLLRNNSNAHKIDRIIETRCVEINIKNGDYEGAEKYFKFCFSTQEKKIDKVLSSYALAEICEHYGREDEAKEYLQFVIENGGDTYYVEEAKLKLGE